MNFKTYRIANNRPITPRELTRFFPEALARYEEEYGNRPISIHLHPSVYAHAHKRRDGWNEGIPFEPFGGPLPTEIWLRIRPEGWSIYRLPTDNISHHIETVLRKLDNPPTALVSVYHRSIMRPARRPWLQFGMEPRRDEVWIPKRRRTA